MPHFVLDKVQNALNDHSKPLRGSHVHILGMAYKKDIDDVRESPALDILHLLMQRGAKITYTDPFVSSIRVEDAQLHSADAEEMASAADCVLIATDHTSFDYKGVVEKSKLIVDTRNALKKYSSEKIVRL
jgi:UDP-N-acetyl-D-mannosaminuronate dehydrogenase